MRMGATGEARSLALAPMDSPGDQASAAAAAALAHGAVDCLPAGELARKLTLAAAEGRPLRVKLGIDPTTADIHLGHTVVFQRLRMFQDAGHTIVLIIGDYTARVGDPSGRSSTRPVLSGEEIDANAATYQAQAFNVLDRERVEVRRNSEWLDMPMAALFRLLGTTTVAQLLERDDFAKRYAANESISMLELLYPLLQGYDSVAIRADVELGGTDQKFNLLLGRQIQVAYGQPPQAVMTLPILPGTDGERKMSKSFDNYVGVTESADEMFGKLLRVPDTALATYWNLLLGSPPPSEVGPRDAKRELARRIVARYHHERAAAAAEARFDRIHIEHELPDEIDESEFAATNGAVHLPALIAELFGGSRSDARRLLAQGGVRLDGVVLGEGDQDLPAARLHGAVLQVGKRRFRRLRQA